MEGQQCGRVLRSSSQFPNSILEQKPLCVFSLLLHFCLHFLSYSPHLLLQFLFSSTSHNKSFWKSSLLFLVSSIPLLSGVYFLLSCFAVILRRTRKLSTADSSMFWFLRSLTYYLLNVSSTGLYCTLTILKLSSY